MPEAERGHCGMMERPAALCYYGCCGSGSYLGSAVGQEQVRAALVLRWPRAVGDKLELNPHLLRFILPPDSLMRERE